MPRASALPVRAIITVKRACRDLRNECHNLNLHVHTHKLQTQKHNNFFFLIGSQLKLHRGNQNPKLFSCEFQIRRVGSQLHFTMQEIHGISLSVVSVVWRIVVTLDSQIRLGPQEASYFLEHCLCPCTPGLIPVFSGFFEGLASCRMLDVSATELSSHAN